MERLECSNCLRPRATTDDEIVWDSIVDNGAPKPPEWPDEEASHLCWVDFGGECPRAEGYDLSPADSERTRPMSPVDIAELRRMLAAGTPGPWTSIRHDQSAEVRMPGRFGAAAWLGTIDGRDNAADAALIVALVNAAPAIFDELEAARQAQIALSLADFGGSLLEQVGAVLDSWRKATAPSRSTPKCSICYDTGDITHGTTGNGPCSCDAGLRKSAGGGG